MKYSYNSFGRLIREDNQLLDKTFIYSYNEFGNIVSAESFAYTTGDVTPGTGTTQSYSYNTTHPDRLTSFGDKAISYNINGCPISYDGKSYSWNRGKLSRIHRGSSANAGALYEYCNFSYDGYGRRVSKSYSYDSNPASTSDYSYSYNTTYSYDTSGRLIYEKCIENYVGGSSRTRDIIYLYDESGIIGAVQTYNNATETFYFDRNLLGDVIGIYNSSGTKVASYTYDAFGNCTAKTLVANNFSAYNPIRYRGYYYDRETKLYYLNVRYYNPEWRRFISPDDTAFLDPESINGLNLYAYCYNDPINYVDPSGHMAFWLAAGLVVAGLGLIGGATYAGISSYNAGNSGWNLVGDIALGGLIGGVAGFALGALGGMGIASLLAGSFVATCSEVYIGLQGLAWAYSLGGFSATGLYVANNFLHSIRVDSSWLGYYPPNNGFIGTPQSITLNSGTIIQHIGDSGGTYVAPYFTDPMSLSLPYHRLPIMNQLNLYIVNQNLTVLVGEAAPWFGQPGGGTQYLLPLTIQQLTILEVISIYRGG